MLIQYENNQTVVNFTELKKLYASVGWHRQTTMMLKEMYEQASYCVFALDGSIVVGCARVLSDFHFNAAIYDLIVDPAYQGKGIGQTMLNLIKKEFQHLSCLHLISTSGNEAFYQKCGFSRLKTAMAIYRNPTLAAEYLE